jgi:hypothetical protein
MTTYLVQAFFKGILIVGLCALAALLSCDDQDEVPATQANINLLFSTDTLLFDTLLTDRLSVTKRLRIYNPNTEAISISEISLSVGTEYSLIINGAEENQAEDLLLMGKDSLLILVKLTVDKQDLDDPYLIKDIITTYWNGNIQQTLLMAWGQDAIYMGNEILCDMTFTADRPYVFYDSVLIDVGCLLTLEAGATLLFDANAPLLVAGQLIAVGDSSHPITFRNSRWDIDYRIAPGQWPGLHFLIGSQNNLLDYTIIENAITGITIGNPDEDTLADLTLKHSIIRHSSRAGLAAYSSDVVGENLLIMNSGSSNIINAAGGFYHYTHCTIVNRPNSFYTSDPATIFTNSLILSDESKISNHLYLTLHNSIVWGPSDNDLWSSDDGQAGWSSSIHHNLIHSNTALNDNYIFFDSLISLFQDIENYNYELDSGSVAIDLGQNSPVWDDLLGRPRDAHPDLGAYEKQSQ